MHAILIDPETQFITSLSIDTDDYERIRQVIGCESLTVAANLPTQDTVFVDRAARVNATPRHFFRVAGCRHPIAGRAVEPACRRLRSRWRFCRRAHQRKGFAGTGHLRTHRRSSERTTRCVDIGVGEPNDTTYYRPTTKTRFPG